MSAYTLVQASISSSQTFQFACAGLVLFMLIFLVAQSMVSLWRAAISLSGRHPALAQRFASGFWLVVGVIGVMVSVALASRT
jgi:uncharacterized membrane protein YozB (DUF420 family)